MSCHDAIVLEWMWPRPQDMREPRMVAMPLVPYQHATRKGCSLGRRKPGRGKVWNELGRFYFDGFQGVSSPPMLPNSLSSVPLGCHHREQRQTSRLE